MLTAFSILLGACIIALAIVFREEIREHSFFSQVRRTGEGRADSRFMSLVEREVSRAIDGGTSPESIVIRVHPEWRMSQSAPNVRPSMEEIQKHEHRWSILGRPIQVVFDPEVAPSDCRIDITAKGDEQREDRG